MNDLIKDLTRQILSALECGEARKAELEKPMSGMATYVITHADHKGYYLTDDGNFAGNGLTCAMFNREDSNTIMDSNPKMIAFHMKDIIDYELEKCRALLSSLESV